MKKWLAIGGTLATITFGATAPIVPVGDMHLVASYQGHYSAQFKTITKCVSLASGTPCVNQTVSAIGDRQVFPKDADGSDMVSWSEFVDSNGNHFLVQIPNLQYAKMGEKDGIKFNPTKQQYDSLIKSFTNPQPANAAIAFDAFSKASGDPNVITSLTVAHTVTGSNTALVVGSGINQPSNDNVIIKSVTYNAVNMTAIATSTADSGSTSSCNTVTAKLWLLLAPTTGANNVVATITGNTHIGCAFYIADMSYTGVAQSGQPDSSGVNHLVASTVNPFTVSTTVVGNNTTWLMGAATEDQGDIAGGTAGAGTTYRGTASNNMFGADSNALVASGSQSLNWGRPTQPSAEIAGVVMSLTQASAATAAPQNGTFILFQ